MNSTPRLPEITKPTCRAWHHSPPTIGRTCSDQRQPGLRDQLADREIPELDDARPDVGELDDVVGVLEALGDDVCHG